MKRVVLTGIGLETPIGSTLADVTDALQSGRHGIERIDEWDNIGDLLTRIGGRVEGDFAGRWPRQKHRTMGRVARLAAAATDSAVADAGLGTSLLTHPSTGLAYGSTHGSSHELETFCRKVFGQSGFEGVPSSSFLRFMSHTTAANLALLYGIRGRVISTCAACVSASQALGAGFEAIRAGAMDTMICGGSEELHWVPAGVFDIFQATSTKYNDSPGESPRPFDKDRDGVVISEGAGTVVLEEYEHAKARGARIYAEMIGYGTNCDGEHLTAPSQTGMEDCMRLALRSAGIAASQVDYINAHGTGTVVGDVAESHATGAVFGSRTPISSTKAFTGHTLGACGAIEVAFCVAMAQQGFLAPTRNLEERDENCADLNYITGNPLSAKSEIMATNNFAFGGINTSLLLAVGDSLES